LRYSKALELGNKQQAIMDEILQKPGIELNWQELNLSEIIAKL
jgi:kynurenine 3-monooxygenase